MSESRVRPVIVLPTGQVTKEDIAVLRENGMCVVEAKDPSLVRFMEPPPNGYSEQERAAISLCRHLLRNYQTSHWTKAEIHEILVHAFTEGSPLKPVEQVRPVKK